MLLPRPSRGIVPEVVIHVESTTNIVPQNGHCSAAISSFQEEMVYRYMGLFLFQEGSGLKILRFAESKMLPINSVLFYMPLRKS